MDDDSNKRLRQEVEAWLRRAMEHIKLVKDEQFCKPVEEKLKLLNDLMLRNQRLQISTLEECRKVIQTAWRKTFSKLVLENHTPDECSGKSTTIEDLLNSEFTECVTFRENCIPPIDQLAADTEQRLALKYPRKKIGLSDNCNPRITSHDIAEQSTSALFKRRHEVFAPAPQAATYSEHRRMMLQEEAGKQNMPKAATAIQPSVKNYDEPSDVSKQFPKTDPLSLQSVCMESSSSNNPPTVCNNNHIVGDESHTVSLNDVLPVLPVLPETANKPADQQCVSECNTKDCETTDGTDDQVVEVVEKSKSAKPSFKNKVNHRELHDLLSYTTEIFPKLCRRKSVFIEEDPNAKLLKQFGITQRVQIVLQRTDCGQAVQRTRSKSIDSTKHLENLGTAKPTVPVKNQIKQRRKSKSMEVKKQTAATTTSAKITKPTARKSVSKPQNNVQPITSSKQRNRSNNERKNVTIEKEPKLAIPNTASKKRTRHSPSPPPAKRTRSSIINSTDIRAAKNGGQNFGEESEEDEPTVLVANVLFNQNPQPNNDVKVHCHSDYMEKCCLCSYNGELMVEHYVYNHPKKAVYVSRVAPEQAQLIRVDPFSISGRKAVSRYGDKEIIVFRCYFCDLRLSESQELWLDHISSHTGEYRYKCTLCPTFARMPIDRVAHHSVCTNPSMQLWHKYNFEENHLYAYMCNKCNFVQILVINMKRHLREDHPEAGSMGVGYTKFSLVNFNLQDEDSELLPYGMVKLEPILDDTNASMQENVEQEVELKLAEDCQTQSSAPFQEIVQEPRLLKPKVILKKRKILTDDIDESKKGRDVCETLSADEPQARSGCSYTTIVRVKKLPGNILSTIENHIPDEGPRNSIPVDHASSLKESNNQLKHSTSNAGSTGTTTTTTVNIGNNQHNPASLMIALQPWNRNDVVNKRLLRNNKLTVPFLIAPYKCIAFNCGFYTDTSQTIGSHFQNHQKPTKTQRIPLESSWLECCYCSYASFSVHNLLRHIETVHKYSAYQCDRCCYRSRDPNSVRVHQRNYHVEHDADAKILCIPGRQKEYTSVDSDIIMNELQSNVKILKCANCSSRKFNDLELYRNHMKMHGMTYIACHVCEQLISAKRIISHISLHNMFMIQCIYCDYGINDLIKIKKHVADKHSDKLLCYHIRCSKPNVPPFIRVQDRISPERFVNC